MAISEDLILIKKLKAEDEVKNIEARRITEFIRPEILAFAEAMEKTMRKHDGNKGDSWKDCQINYLYIKLNEEFTEVETAVYNRLHKAGKINEISKELVDLANVSAMLWNRNEIKE